jgi:hypothetical protein
MNHPNREEWVPYIFGEAAPDARRRLGEHLRGCADCRAELDAWRHSLGRLNEWKLPKVRRPSEVWQPRLQWAVAALVVLAMGFGLGRLAWPGSSPTGDWRAQVDLAVKAALATELSREPRPSLAIDFQNALDRAQSQTSNALARLEVGLANASELEARQLLSVLTEMLDRAREEDRQAVLALFHDLEQQHTAAYVALRKDLEKLASLTDEEIRQARLRLVQLAADTRTNENE